MKKLLLLLLFVPIVSFGQGLGYGRQTSTYDVTVKDDMNPIFGKKYKVEVESSLPLKPRETIDISPFLELSKNLMEKANRIKANNEQMYRQESMQARGERIREARNTKLSKWINKEFIGEDLSKYKYLFLMPSDNLTFDKAVLNANVPIKKFKKLWRREKILPTFVNIIGKHSTHKNIPSALKEKPESVLYMYLNVLTPTQDSFSQDTYIQLYDYRGNLIYANKKLNTFYPNTYKKLITDWKFALQFN
tara:strand:- start:2071 stop:2814 length:744 start_codon:yes stop_codon:yes gene_type:complete